MVQIGQQQILPLPVADDVVLGHLVDPPNELLPLCGITQIHQRSPLPLGLVGIGIDQRLVLEGVVQNQGEWDDMVHFKALVFGVEGGPLVCNGPAGIQALPVLLLRQPEPLHHGTLDLVRAVISHDLADLLLVFFGLGLVLLVPAVQFGPLGPGAAQIAGHFHIHRPGRTVLPDDSVDDFPGFVEAAHHHRVLGKFCVCPKGRQFDMGAAGLTGQRLLQLIHPAPLKFTVPLALLKGFHRIPHIVGTDFGGAGNPFRRQPFCQFR